MAGIQNIRKNLSGPTAKVISWAIIITFALFFGWGTVFSGSDANNVLSVNGKKVDVFDYWIHTKERREPIESLDADKIGWIGECSNGDARALTKYSWENPHPDKKVSHIDFEGGLSETAPFIVAITIELIPKN